MARGETKRILLEVGRTAFLEKGYNHAGIEEILRAANVPKGSFYNFFDSKEDFALQVLDEFAACLDQQASLHLNNSSLSPLQRIRSYFQSMIDHLESKQCRNGCLIGNLSQELADQNESFRARLKEIFESWTTRLSSCIELCQQAGEIPPGRDPHALAEFWLTSWQGALWRAKMIRDSAPLRSFLAWTIDAV